MARVATASGSDPKTAGFGAEATTAGTAAAAVGVVTTEGFATTGATPVFIGVVCWG